jgi:UDP-glucose 4-epimerase
MRNILVIGAGGFIGSALVEHLCRLDCRVYAVSRSLGLLQDRGFINLAGLSFYPMELPDDALADLIKTVQFDTVVYSAGTSSVGKSVMKPYEDYLNSVNPLAFVLECIRQYSPESHFIFLSSAAVYGNQSITPITEHAPLKPISAYGFHKKVCELLLEEYSTLYGLQTTALRIFSAYGTFLKKQVVYDFCSKIVSSRTDLEILGTGKESRDFIHLKDVCRAIELVAAKRQKGIFNLASGTETSIVELAGLLSHILGIHKSFTFTGAENTGNPVNWRADISSLKSLGFTISKPFREGLEEYCTWFSSQAGRSN